MSAIKVSAPGSIMLMGEHAVLFGHKALACAVDKRITVTLEPRKDQKCRIHSVLADYSAGLDQLKPEPRLSFVLAAINSLKTCLPNGFDLQIHTEFSHQVGLGSSAAVTAAVVAALLYHTGSQPSREQVFDQTLSVVHQVQGGRGSGTDIAASIWGGIISYQVQPRSIIPLPGRPPLALFYAGYKTPTPEVLRRVEIHTQAAPALYPPLYRLMGEVVEQAEVALNETDFSLLGHLMNYYQGLMDALGVNDRTLADMIYQLRADPQVLGAKISGSGLGDCVVALGTPELIIDHEKIPLTIGEGLSIHA